jgi:LCP family protein required for cell wall assembly
MSSSPLKRRLWIGGAVVALLLVGAGAVFAAYTWGDVNRVSIDRPEADDSSGPVASEEDPGREDDGAVDNAEQRVIVDPGRQVFVLVGSDSREDLTDTSGFGEFEGNRADVVMVLFKEPDGTGLLSVPRDLLVENPCGGRDDRISSLLEGCDDYNGPTLLTLAVEDLIGHPVDHFALVDLAGFQEAVDALGGYEICVDNPVRDIRAKLELPAGCTEADGEQTLAWMRSRRTQELTDSGWRTMTGVNDLARNERQRSFLIDMMSRMGDITSPRSMMSAAQKVAPFVTIDSELTLLDAVDLAMTMKGLGSGAIVELEIPVSDATTEDGAAVLVPTRPVDEIIADFLSTMATSPARVFLGLAG